MNICLLQFMNIRYLLYYTWMNSKIVSKILFVHHVVCCRTEEIFERYINISGFITTKEKVFALVFFLKQFCCCKIIIALRSATQFNCFIMLFFVILSRT